MTSLLSTFLAGSLIGFSLILLLVSIASYRRTKNSRLLLVSVGFFIFLLKGILLIIGLVFVPGLTESIELLLLLDLVILLFLYFAIAKR